MTDTRSTTTRPVQSTPRLVVQMSETDLRSIMAEYVDQIGEIVASRPPKVLLDTAGVSQLLGVSPPMVRRLIDEGMPHVRVGEMRRYDGDEVLSWLKSRSEVGR